MKDYGDYIVSIPELTENLLHGMYVSKLGYALAQELKCTSEESYNIATAGLLHDIGKLKLNNYVSGRNNDIMKIDELRYVRTHSTIGYAVLQKYGYNRRILDAVMYHHENYDGTGYPSNLEGEEIPFEARIIRVCDSFAALISNRPYRSAFDRQTAVELMIEEVKNYDLRIFMAFQNVLQSEELMKSLDNMKICEG